MSCLNPDYDHSVLKNTFKNMLIYYYEKKKTKRTMFSLKILTHPRTIILSILKE